MKINCNFIYSFETLCFKIQILVIRDNLKFGECDGRIKSTSTNK